VKFRWAAIVAAVLCLASSTSFAAYTDKDIHDSGDATYKHPNQKSFTGPFDYAPATKAEAPAARPTGKCNVFTFDATKSNDVDRDKLSINWDFGDGTSSDKPVVTKTYDKAGTYDVKLTVKDSSGQICDSGVATTRVDANFPPTAEAGEDRTACLGNIVSFDASGSQVNGTPAYRWDFGDGHTGEGARASHSYEKPGTYRVRLFIDDGKGTECSTSADSTTVTIADRAVVTLEDSQSVCLGQSVRLRANGTGGASNYRWDFGDGQTWEGGAGASHQYEKPGTYTVRVSADNGKGTDCSTASDSTTVSVHGQPVANAGDNLACCVGQEVTFDASNSTSPAGAKLTYLWNFGDGNSGEGQRVTHAYQKYGNYRVVLTVKDDSGSACSQSSDSFVAVVNAKPEAVIQVR
jgi:PKD repeat protein